jgi:hypothetical protein
MIFDKIKPLLRKHTHGVSGGTGLKLHPDGRLRNLYYWLLDEDVYVRGNSGVTIPKSNLPYDTENGIAKKKVAKKKTAKKKGAKKKAAKGRLSKKKVMKKKAVKKKVARRR